MEGNPDSRRDGQNGGNAAHESQQPRKRKTRDELSYAADITGVASESSSDRKVSSASDHFRFSSVSAASQDIKQQARDQRNIQATNENDIYIVQHLLKLLMPSQNAPEVSSEGHKGQEENPVPSSSSNLPQEQNLGQLSSSDSVLSNLLEMLRSQQEQQQILADFVVSNTQQEQDHLNILAQLLSSLSQQQQQREQQQIEADRLNLLLQLLNQIANASSHQDSASSNGSSQVEQLPSYYSFTQNLSQQPNSSSVDLQSLLVSLLNALSASTSSEPTMYSRLSPPADSGTIPLSTPNDSDRKLSDYQLLLRQQLEFFVAQNSDVDSSTQGRRKQVHLGQVGLRCRHCAHLPLRSRERGAVYYPAKLENVYQSAQNMASTHLMESCKNIDSSVRHELQELRDRKHTAMGGKTQWAEACQEMGLYEAEEGGLRLSAMPSYSS